MTTPDGLPQATPLRQMKVLASVLMAAPLALGVYLLFTLSGDQTGSPDIFAVVVVAAVGLLAALLIPVVGYRVSPVQSGVDRVAVGDASRQQFQAGMIVRFALSEAVALIGVALAFVTASGGLWVFGVGLVIGELLMARHVWPGEYPISRTEQALESGGSTSWLRDALERSAAADPA